VKIQLQLINGFYVPDMTADEILLLKCYDSRTDGPCALLRRIAPSTIPTTTRQLRRRGARALSCVHWCFTLELRQVMRPLGERAGR